MAYQTLAVADGCHPANYRFSTWPIEVNRIQIIPCHVLANELYWFYRALLSCRSMIENHEQHLYFKYTLRSAHLAPRLTPHRKLGQLSNQLKHLVLCQPNSIPVWYGQKVVFEKCIPRNTLILDTE